MHKIPTNGVGTRQTNTKKQGRYGRRDIHFLIILRRMLKLLFPINVHVQRYFIQNYKSNIKKPLYAMPHSVSFKNTLVTKPGYFLSNMLTFRIISLKLHACLCVRHYKIRTKLAQMVRYPEKEFEKYPQGPLTTWISVFLRRILWNPKFHYSVYNNKPQVPILS
jgi:hypothetical protein